MNSGAEEAETQAPELALPAPRQRDPGPRAGLAGTAMNSVFAVILREAGPTAESLAISWA